jgi:hypothetical protein
MFAVLPLAALPLATPAQQVPAPSNELVQALAAVRAADMPALIAWAAQPVAPAAPTGAVSAAEMGILALAQPDRDALLFWLRAHGRGALHAQGASDRDIGVPYYAIDYAIVPAPFPASVTPLVMPAVELPPPAPTPTDAPARHHGFGFLGSLLPTLNLPIASSSSSSTSSSTTQNGNSTEFNQTTQSSGASVSIDGNPWQAVGSLIDASMDRASNRAAPAQPWRSLPFAASTLGAPGSQILVTRGFAAVRYDGTEGAACISFVNQAPVAATQVDVDIEILDGLGFVKRVQALRRAGNFAPGAEIGGPTGPQTIQNARENCVIDGENRLDDPTDPFSRASAVVYAVRQVFYADGTSWLAPGANPWAP